MTRRICLIALCTLAALAHTANAYDPVTDFSIVGNPTGAWSYGQTSTLGGSFSFLPIGQTYLGGTVEAWRGATPGAGNGGYPFILKNTTGSTQTNAISGGSNYTHVADELVFQVGDIGFGNAIPVLRFTVPTAGSYQMLGAFTGRDQGFVGSPANTTADVHIMRNSGALFNGNINVNGGGNVASFNLTQTFSAGDVIDFVVGDGGNGIANSESTGLKLSITAASAPEPTTLLFLAVGGTLTLVRRQRKSH